MSLEDLIAALDALSDDDLDALAVKVRARQTVRWALASAQVRAEQVQADADAELERIATGYLTARDGQTDPDHPPAWVRPTGPHDSYPRGAAVTHAGAIWDNPNHPVNSWEPGVVGSPWVMRVQADPGTGHVAWAPGQQVYAAGGDPDDPAAPADERTHDGRLWGCKVTHVTHEGWVPSVHTHAVWEDRGPLEAASRPARPSPAHRPT